MKIGILTRNFKLGELKFSPFASLDGATQFPEYSTVEGVKSIHLKGESSAFSDDIYIRETENGSSVRRVFKNITNETVKLFELGFRIDGITFGEKSSDDYYYHVENPRLFDRFVALVDQDRYSIGSLESEYDETAGNKWVDPGVITERVGNSPYQPFPAILVSNLNTARGLVHGTLSQNVFYHCYHLYHKDDFLCFDIFSAFKDIDYREVKPGEILVDEWYIGTTDKAGDIEAVFDKYSAELRKVLPANYGATDINRDNLLWGTWNDGIGRKVTEKLIFDEVPFLKKYFPNVKWIQLDDGYCAFLSETGFRAHGLGVPYEGDDGVDHEKFPHGLRYVSDKLRDMGFRPAVWIGGYCPKDTKISRERPDLMCEYSSRNKRCYVLDVSNPETREYMSSALDTMLYEWGFEGVKHDFWSYAFEVSEPLLHNNERSGYEYRHWWLDEVRKRLPGDAYFQTGCDIVMGNPFLGTHFTNYRYGIDIGAGAWRNFKKNYIWCMACLATHTGDIFVPNSDAVGMFPGFDDTDAYFAVNFVLITRTMVELAGRFSAVDIENPRFKMLKKATCNINNGQDVFFADYDYRTANTTPPAVLYIKTPHFSTESGEGLPLRTVAFFNIDEKTKKSFKITPKSLGLEDGEYVLTNVWTGEQHSMRESFELTLDPHGSALYSVNEKTGINVFDSNVKLSGVRVCKNSLTAHLHYGAECEISLSFEPTELLLDGESAKYEYSNGSLKFVAEKESELEIKF